MAKPYRSEQYSNALYPKNTALIYALDVLLVLYA